MKKQYFRADTLLAMKYRKEYRLRYRRALAVPGKIKDIAHPKNYLALGMGMAIAYARTRMRDKFTHTKLPLQIAINRGSARRIRLKDRPRRNHGREE